MNYSPLTTVILDLDDCASDAESNALNWMVDLKMRFPDFRATLFTIIGRWKDKEMLKKMKEFLPWIDLAAHGFEHMTNDEVLIWDRKRWKEILKMYENMGIFEKIFKAPNWEMSPLGYEVLGEMGWAVAVRQFQINDLPVGIKYYCFETNPFGVHGHTWTLPAHFREGMLNWGGETHFDTIVNNLEIKT